LQAKVGDRLLEDPEHHIKDSPNITKHDSTILYTGWYYIVDTDNGFKRQLDKSTDTFFIDPKPIVVAKNFTTFEIYESDAGGQKYIGLSMRLDEDGTEKWSDATEKAIGKQLAFILDNRLLQVAKVNAQITAGVTALNRGDYSRAELENIKTIIESEK
jgi:preprotein translocase subunit SecD